MTDTTISRTIIEQIRAADIWYLGAVAARKFVFAERHVSFSVNASKLRHGRVIIALAGDDIYTITTGSVRKGMFGELDRTAGVYCDQLVPVLEDMIGG